MKNKIIVTLTLMITMLFGILIGNSQATYLGSMDQVKSLGAGAVGNNVSASVGIMQGRRDLYCINYNTKLHGTIPYLITRYIEINGNTAKNDYGATLTSIENGKLAYILRRGEGYGAVHNYTSTQRALYGEINNWYYSVGQYIGVPGSVANSNNDAYRSEALIGEAGNYAAGIGTAYVSDNVTDKTDTSKVKVKSFTDNDTAYLKVGPFKWEYSGEITNVTVYGDNDSKISNVKYARYEGEKEISSSKASEVLVSGKKFYLILKADNGFTKIGKIVAKHKNTKVSTVYTARVWVLNYSNYQTLLLADTGEDNPNPEPVETPFNYNIPLTKNIELTKVDSVKNTKLQGVKFILQEKASGKYIQETSENKYKLVTKKSNATEFTTNKNGKITIKKLPIATYLAYETENPNKGYIIKENAVTISASQTEKAITNKYRLGSIVIEKVDKDNTDIKLKDVEFTLQATSGQYKGKYVGRDDDKNATYSNEPVILKTSQKGKITIKNIWEGNYTLTEVKNPNYGYSISSKNPITVTVKPYEITTKQVKNKYNLGEINIEKQDKDHPEIKLGNVEFTLTVKSATTADGENLAGKYVYIDSNGNAKYSDTERRVKTDANGKLNIKQLWKGKYTLTEVYNPNAGYVIDDNSKNIAIKVEARKTTEQIVYNKQNYIKLSGYIWLDEIADDKASTRNNYFKTNGTSEGYVDGKDKDNCNGINVRLKRKEDGSIVQQTISGEYEIYDEINGGEYVFENVDIDGLEHYYVEFEYDGIIYQSVETHLDHNNGSKANDKTSREVLDINFKTVNGTGENKINVNDTYSIEYNETKDYQSTIKYVEKENSSIKELSYTSENKGKVNATTMDAQCNLADYYTPGQTEIKYINLGLYERPTTNIALAKDLENVNVGVNGYWHIYEYNSKGKELDNYDANAGDSSNNPWNVGVKFTNNTGGYKRAIYKADTEYTSEDNSKELQVYLTYKIRLKNQGSDYKMQVNSIVDYFDSTYEFIKAGTEIDEKNNVVGELDYKTVESENANYKKIIIATDKTKANETLTINPNTTESIYVQFKLDRTAVLDIMNNKNKLYNHAEINSYTAYDKDSTELKTISAIDRASVPGNAKLENYDTYENDTDTAPPVQLELSNARTITGSVFEDISELKENRREGNGIFDEGTEKAISGIKVTLHEINGAVADKETVTDENGYYTFTDFIPGQYTITYTWGDKTYTVQDYKGTIYDSSRNQNNMNWYKEDIETRKTDAIDNYNTRIEIDKQIAEMTDRTQITQAYEENYSGEIINKMDSTTPTMEFSVEYDTTVTDGTGNKVEFIVKNIDFGIVERAKQQLDMSKRIKTFKITLANGQVLIDATVDEDGNVTGTKNSLTYMGPEVGFNGYIKAEIDEELLEGATMEATYEIKAKNNSETDYATQSYYTYGIIGTENDLITLTPSTVVDFLDKNLGFDTSKNTSWEQVDVDNEAVKKSSKADNKDYLNKRKILITEELNKELKPTESKSIELNVSKLLTTSEELTFNNDAETVKVDRKKNGNHSGRLIGILPFASAEEIRITESTGDDRNYVVPAIIAITSLIALGAGTFTIKKFVIKK